MSDTTALTEFSDMHEELCKWTIPELVDRIFLEISRVDNKNKELRELRAYARYVEVMKGEGKVCKTLHLFLSNRSWMLFDESRLHA